MLDPPTPKTVRLTELVPTAPYEWLRLVAAVFVVLPSPKFQNRFVIVPLELSVNVTPKAAAPVIGLALKLATSGLCDTI